MADCEDALTLIGYEFGTSGDDAMIHIYAISDGTPDTGDTVNVNDITGLPGTTMVSYIIHVDMMSDSDNADSACAADACVWSPGTAQDTFDLGGALSNAVRALHIVAKCG